MTPFNEGFSYARKLMLDFLTTKLGNEKADRKDGLKSYHEGKKFGLAIAKVYVLGMPKRVNSRKSGAGKK
jgi:hypothetical protein